MINFVKLFFLHIFFLGRATEYSVKISASLLWASSGLVNFFFSDRIRSINFINFLALKGPEGGPDIIDVLKSSGVGEQFQEWPWKFLLIPWLMETIKHQFGWLRHSNYPRRDHFSRYFIHKLRHINAQSNGKKDLGTGWTSLTLKPPTAAAIFVSSTTDDPEEHDRYPRHHQDSECWSEPGASTKWFWIGRWMSCYPQKKDN